MKIAITGASGFIGQHMVIEALNQSYSVVALTRLSQEDYLARLSTIQADVAVKELTVATCDLHDSATVTKAIEHCDTLVHLAAAMHGNNPTNETLSLTKNILKATHDSNISCLMLISSVSILDYRQQTALSTIDETTPICDDEQHLGHYAIMKRNQEKLCQHWHTESGKQLIIIRPGLVYSDTQLSNAHAGFIKKGIGVTALHNGQVPLVHVDQVAKQVIQLMSKRLSSKEIFHLIDQPGANQSDYVDRLKHQGLLHFHIPLPWQAYQLMSKIIRWTLTKLNKQNNIPDSFFANSVAARQKPFIFSSKKVHKILQG